MEPTAVDPDPLSLDLSHLSAEERALIQNVMAKAKNMEASESVLPVAPQPATR
jgi:hypothetical protein